MPFVERSESRDHTFQLCYRLKCVDIVSSWQLQPCHPDSCVVTGRSSRTAGRLQSLAMDRGRGFPIRNSSSCPILATPAACVSEQRSTSGCFYTGATMVGPWLGVQKLLVETASPDSVRMAAEASPLLLASKDGSCS